MRSVAFLLFVIVLLTNPARAESQIRLKARSHNPEMWEEVLQDLRADERIAEVVVTLELTPRFVDFVETRLPQFGADLKFYCVKAQARRIEVKAGVISRIPPAFAQWVRRAVRKGCGLHEAATARSHPPALGALPPALRVYLSRSPEGPDEWTAAWSLLVYYLVWDEDVADKVVELALTPMPSDVEESAEGTLLPRFRADLTFQCMETPNAPQHVEAKPTGVEGSQLRRWVREVIKRACTKPAPP